MDIEKLFERATENGIAAISAAVEELKRQGQQAEREADAAYKAYFADSEEKETKVKRRLADLSQQEDEIKRKIGAMQPGLVSATVAGDSEAFDRIQNDLAGLEAQRAAIVTQIQLLSDAPLPGSLELYQAAGAKCEALDKAAKQWRSDIERVRAFVREQAKAWERLNDMLGYTTFYTPGLCRRDFVAVDTHFKTHRPIDGQS